MKDKDKLTLKEFLTNKQYRAILFLIAYFIVFLILIIMSRIGAASSYDSTVKDDSIQKEGMEYVLNKNFNFEYTLTDNETVTKYIGKQYENKIEYTKDDKSYFISEDLLLENQDGKYVLSQESPYTYFNFFDVDLVNTLIEKTKSEDEIYSLNFSDYKELTKDSTEVGEGVITIKLNKNNNIVTSIDFDFGDYYKDHKVTLNLKYSDFNVIDDFEIQ